MTDCMIDFGVGWRRRAKMLVYMLEHDYDILSLSYFLS